MKFMLSLLAFGYVALANPTPSLPVHPGGIGGLFKGPNSETIIKGPDGSVITAAAEGGEVLTDVEPVAVAPAAVEVIAAAPVAIEAAPVAVEAGPVAVAAAPVAIEAGPVAIAAAPVAIEAAPVIEAVAVPAPVVESEQSSDLIGPSGRIATKGSQAVIAGPASTTVTGPAVVAETVVKGPPIIGAPVLGAAPAEIAVPLTVTAAPVVAEVAPIAVTAAPVAALPVVTSGPPIPSVATVTATSGLSVSSAAPIVENVEAISIVTPTPLGAVPSAAGIGRLDVVQDQLAIDNRQLNLNPALIPSANIIPPEVPVTPRLPIGRLRPTPGPIATLGVVPTPGTLLTTPGLGAVGPGTNIQREEGDTSSLTPNSLQVTPELAPTPQQIAALQTQQALLNNQIQHTQSAIPSNVQREEIAATLGPSQISQAQLLQNQQILLSNQIQHAQQAAGPGGLLPSPAPTGRPLFTGNQATSLASIQRQNLLGAELAKSGIDASRVQVTNVPLSAVSALPAGGLGGGPGNGQTWGRYGRDAGAGTTSGGEAKSD